MPAATDRQDPKVQRVRLALQGRLKSLLGEVEAKQGATQQATVKATQQATKEMTDEGCAEEVDKKGKGSSAVVFKEQQGMKLIEFVIDKN